MGLERWNVMQFLLCGCVIPEIGHQVITHFLSYKNNPLNRTHIHGAGHDVIFTALSFTPLANLLIYGRYIGILYLRTPQCCTAFSKTAARE